MINNIYCMLITNTSHGQCMAFTCSTVMNLNFYTCEILKFLFFSVTLYDKMVVLEAVVLTLGVTVGLTMYTMQSKRDFSSWGAG